MMETAIMFLRPKMTKMKRPRQRKLAMFLGSAMLNRIAIFVPILRAFTLSNSYIQFIKNFLFSCMKVLQRRAGP